MHEEAAGIPRSVTPGDLYEIPYVGSRIRVVRKGYDDVSVGFDLTGSRSIARLNELPGLETRRGKMLGEKGSWGEWVHHFGWPAWWKADNLRLYVQLKLAPQGDLCPPEAAQERFDEFLQRMAIVGVEVFGESWITRVDVAVDAQCAPETGKLLLDALEACRLPKGWRTQGAGNPRSTVYFKARASEKVYARAYDRNLKTKTGEPFGLIRLEAQHNFPPMKVPTSVLENTGFAQAMWEGRYGVANVQGRVQRLSREAQVMTLMEMVRAGEIGRAAAERLSMYLDLERLGLAQEFYGPRVYAERRREARKYGLSANDSGTDALDLDVGELVRPYQDSWVAA